MNTQDKEVLGEWDAGFFLPNGDDWDEDSDVEDERPSLRSLANGLCGTGLVNRVLTVEHVVEVCIREAILKVEDKVERLLVSDDKTQDGPADVAEHAESFKVE
jgi:hypothetical protein